jgi:Domain of unknown function (DUF4340)
VSEIKTTAIFGAAAAVSLGLAWWFGPTTVKSEKDISDERKGQSVFGDFNTDTAASFRIVKFNEDLATLSQLELAKDGKQMWTLPTADGYPADSAEQVSQAVAPLTSLTVLSTVSTDRSDHVLYGVVEPKEDELDVSASGVGMLLRVGGPKGEVLAELIVGKQVQGATDQRYVRIRAEDAVYVVELKTDPYSTQLDKWIKGEILNVRSMDINFVGVRDYEIQKVDGGYGLIKNFDSDLEFKDNKWSMQKFVDHKQKSESTEPPEGQELSDSALNDLRTSVQGLKIVSVRRKPAGLALELKADQSLLKNEESIKSLNSQGFFPMESGDVYAFGGELVVGTKDGVRYVLRFGSSTINSSAIEGEDKDEKEKEKDAGSEAVRRHVLVTAQFDESKFPAPELKHVPETVEEMLAQEAEQKAKTQAPGPGAVAPTSPTPSPSPEGAPTDPAAKDPSAPSEPTAESTAPPAEVKPETATEAKPEANKTEPDAPQTGADPEVKTPPAEPEPVKDPNENSLSASDLDDAAKKVTLVTTQQPPPDDAPKPAEDAPKPTDEKPAVEKPQDASASATSVAPAQAEGKTELAPSARQETAEELKERLQFMQETIKKENQRKIDARNEAIKQGKKKVDELNASFADWYYIINDSAYTKLRIPRDKLFKAKGAPAPAGPGAGPGAGLGDAFPPGFSFPNN